MARNIQVPILVSIFQEQSQTTVPLLKKIVAITRTIFPPGDNAVESAEKDLRDVRQKVRILVGQLFLVVPEMMVVIYFVPPRT